MRLPSSVLASLALCLLLAAPRAHAQEPVPTRTPPPRPNPSSTETMTAEEAMRRFFHPSPEIHDGATELGLSLAFVSIEHEQASSFGLSLGTYRALSDGLIGWEAGVQDTRAGGVHVVDLDGELSWQRPVRSGVYPFLAAGGGVRKRRVNGDSETTYPLGGGVGVRSLIGDRAAFRAEYRFRRVLSDPVADFSEHQLWVSFSVFLRNRPTK